MEDRHDAQRSAGDAPPPRRGRHDIVENEQPFLWPEAESLLNDDYTDLPRAGDYRLSGVSESFDDQLGYPSASNGGGQGGRDSLFEPRPDAPEPRVSRPSSGLFGDRPPPPTPPPGDGYGLFGSRGEPAGSTGQPVSSSSPDPWSVDQWPPSQSPFDDPTAPGTSDRLPPSPERHQAANGYPAPDPHGSANQYPAPDPYGSEIHSQGQQPPAPDPHGSASGYPAPDPHGSANGYPAPDPHGSASGYPAPDPHGSANGYPAPDPHGSASQYPAPDPYGSADPYRQSQHPGDPYGHNAQRHPEGPYPLQNGSGGQASRSSEPTLVEQWPVGFPAGDASGQASPPTFLERSTVVDPQSGAPAQTGSSFADADHRWDGYDQVSGYAGNGHEQTRALDNGSGDGSRSLLSDHTDPSMPYPAIRSAETAYQYSDHNPGAMAALLDMSDRRWFTVVVTGGLALVLLAIVYAAFTLGGDDSPNESVIAGSTTLPGSTSSIPEGSAGAPTIEDPTSTVEDPSSAGGSVETTESTDTTVTSVVDEMVEVPRLRGYGRVIASDILRELDLGVNVQERKVPVGSGENALVIDQDPDPGTMVEPGTVVTIYVAQESSNQ